MVKVKEVAGELKMERHCYSWRAVVVVTGNTRSRRRPHRGWRDSRKHFQDDDAQVCSDDERHNFVRCRLLGVKKN